MSIAVVCENCGRDYTVKDEAAGLKFRCQDCGRVIEVPGLPLTAAEAPDGPWLSPLADQAVGAGTAYAEDLPQRGSRRLTHDDSSSRRWGKVSLVLGAIVWGLSIVGLIAFLAVCFAISRQLPQGGQGRDQALQLGMIAGFGVVGGGCSTCALAIVGAMLGTVAVLQPAESKGQAIAGLVLNGLFLVLASGAVLLSIILSQS